MKFREGYDDRKCFDGYEYVKGYRKANGEYVKSFCRKKHYKDDVKKDKLKEIKRETIPKITDEVLDGKTVYIKTLNGIYSADIGGEDNTLRFHFVKSLKPDDKYYYIPIRGDFPSLAREISDDWWYKRDKR